jgi:hypothetical protein
MRQRSRGIATTATAVTRIRNLGFTSTQALASTRDTLTEELFNATSAAASQIELTGVAGQPYRVLEASLFKVKSYETYNPWTETVLLTNESISPRAYTCAAAGLRTCDVLGLAGQTITWPVTVPAQSSVVVVTADAKFR